MYSVRKNTRQHGNTNLNMLFLNLVVTAVLTWQFGTDYLVIFCSTTIFVLIIESGLALSGIRKGVVYVYGRKLPRAAELFLRASVEGPAFCVPAFFVADQLLAGRIMVGLAGSILAVGIGSLYIGLADRNDLRRLAPGEEPLISRRAMTRPWAVMFLALFNTGCLVALFLMPEPYRTHAFTYVIAFSLLVMLFYIINYNLGVRMVEIYDQDRGEYTKPGPFFQAAGLAYDSAYEMALLISPAYWVAFYLGLFQYTTIT
jgi:hypothetical protein